MIGAGEPVAAAVAALESADAAIVVDDGQPGRCRHPPGPARIPRPLTPAASAHRDPGAGGRRGQVAQVGDGRTRCADAASPLRRRDDRPPPARWAVRVNATLVPVRRAPSRVPRSAHQDRSRQGRPSLMTLVDGTGRLGRRP